MYEEVMGDICFGLHDFYPGSNPGPSSPSITRADLLTAISKITLAHANLDVIYSRPNGAANVTTTP